MTPKFVVPAILTLVAFTSPVLHAAGSGDMEKEYQQIRTVALRDPKIKAAYAEADRKLEAKIVQLDPALAGYRSHGASEPAKPAKPASTPKPATSAKAAPVKGGFHAPHTTATPSAPAAAAASATHTVASGETLGGIASHYGVTVAALKGANHIADEKKLAVGQVLTIPAKKH